MLLQLIAVPERDSEVHVLKRGQVLERNQEKVNRMGWPVSPFTQRSTSVELPCDQF